MNTFKIKIDGKTFKPSPYGCKFANLLDERLDEGYIVLKHLEKQEPFRPFTLVEIEFINDNKAFRTVKKAYDDTDITQEIVAPTGRLSHLRQTKKEYFFIADDDVTNYPNGSEFYNHSLYIIELSKILERFMGDSITFTNVI